MKMRAITKAATENVDFRFFYLFCSILVLDQNVLKYLVYMGYLCEWNGIDSDSQNSQTSILFSIPRIHTHAAHTHRCTHKAHTLTGTVQWPRRRVSGAVLGGDMQFSEARHTLEFEWLEIDYGVYNYFLLIIFRRRDYNTDRGGF